MSWVTLFPETVYANEGTATVKYGAFGSPDYVDGVEITCDPDPPIDEEGGDK